MINRHALFAALLCGSFIFVLNAYAQDMDVDEADTLDFGAFHKDKKEAIKAWEKDSSKPTKAYSDTTPAPAATGTAVSSGAKVAAGTTAAAAAIAPATTAAAKTDKRGKRYEIRERYTLTRSVKTPYSAFYVLEPLAKQAAHLCPHGWKKLAERSEPIEQDYYLYQDIECL